MITLLKLISGHIIGDFFLQSDVLAKRKKDSLLYLSIHSLINAVAVYVVLAQFQLWWIMPVIFATHLAIDYVKSRWTSDSTKHFLLDQAAHLSVLGIIWFIISGDVTAVWTSVQNILECGTSTNEKHTVQVNDAGISVDRTHIQEMEFRRPGLQGIAECRKVDWLYRAYIDSDVHCDAQFLCSGLLDNSEVCVPVL